MAAMTSEKGIARYPTSCTISFNPDVNLIDLVREFVTNLYNHVIGSGETSDKVAIATHELLENSVRYSLDGETIMRIEFTPETTNRTRLLVRVQNRANDSHTARVRALLDEMAGACDAGSFFQALIERTADSEESGLGLARIWAEADMRLTYQRAGDLLTITAQTEFS